MSKYVTPAGAKCYIKELSKGVEDFKLGATYNKPNQDSNTSLDGIQNEAEIRFNPVIGETYFDLSYVTYSKTGLEIKPVIKDAGGYTTLNTAINDSELNVLIDPPDYGQKYYKVNATIRIEDELVTIKTINKSVNPWSITLYARGSHNTAASSHSGGVAINACIWTGKHQIITLSDFALTLPAPTNFDATSILDFILLEWDWVGGSEIENLALRGFRIYYDTSSGITTSDDAIFVSGNQLEETETGHYQYKFTKQSSNKILVGNTYYFRVGAVNQIGESGTLSSEINAELAGASAPSFSGPPTPEVNLSSMGNYRIYVNAKKPTSTQPLTALANIKKCDFELYYAAVGDGNPTTGTPDGNQTLVVSKTDNATPYEFTQGVSSHGYGEYWARAKFYDDDDVDSVWSLSNSGDVFTLNDYTNTTDTDIPSGITITTGSSPYYVGKSRTTTYVYFHINTISTNSDSVDSFEVQLRKKDNGSFSASTGFSDVEHESVINTRSDAYSRIGFDLELAEQWEYTARVHNVFGWSDYTTPATLTVSTDINSVDVDLPDIDKFGAWTTLDAHPTGNPSNLAGDELYITLTLGDDNFTTNKIQIFGHPNSLPSETVSKSQSDGTLTATQGTYEFSISGFSATLNQYAGYFLRLGRDDGTANDTVFFEEYEIASNTAGDPFTITVTGNYRTRNNGTVSYWKIVDNFLRDKCQFYREVAVLPGTEYVQPELRYRARKTTSGNGLVVAARAVNVFGPGALRYSDSTITGTLTPGSAVEKDIAGIVEDDVDDGAITAGKQSVGSIPVICSIFVSPLTGNEYRGAEWTSGYVWLPDGATESISSGNSGTLSTDAVYYLYKTSGNSNLSVSTSPSDALGDNKYLIGTIITTSDTNENITYLPSTGTSSIIAANIVACNYLSAFTADMGTLTSGVIRCPGTGTSYIKIDGNAGTPEIQAFGNNIQTVSIKADGSGFLGTGTDKIVWGTGGITSIPGGPIDADTIPTASLKAQARRFFTNMEFYASDYRTVKWRKWGGGDGTITIEGESAKTVNASTTGTGSMTTGSGDIYYIYYVVDNATLQVTKDYATDIEGHEDRIVMCLAWASSNTNAMAAYIPIVGVLGINDTVIGDNSISTGMVQADAITTNELAANSVTATEINVAQLSAISAALGSITSGTITGALIRTAASGARVFLNSAGITMKNSSDVNTARFDASDGSGWLGTSGGFAWDSSGDITATGITLRTGASGGRVEIDASSGFNAYDTSGNNLVSIPVSGIHAGSILLTQDDSAPGKLIFGSGSSIYSTTTNDDLYIAPETGGTEYLHLGGESTRWNSVFIEVEDYASVQCSGTSTSSVTLDGSTTDPFIILRTDYGTIVQSSLEVRANDATYGESVLCYIHNVIKLAVQSSEISVACDIIPFTDDAYDLGSASKAFADGYFEGDVRVDRLISKDDSDRMIDMNVSSGIAIDSSTSNPYSRMYVSNSQCFLRSRDSSGYDSGIYIADNSVEIKVDGATVFDAQEDTVYVGSNDSAPYALLSLATTLICLGYYSVSGWEGNVLCTENAVSLRHSTTQKLTVTSSSIILKEDITCDTDSAYDIGTDGVRVANIYCDTIYRNAEADIAFANKWKIREFGVTDEMVEWAAEHGDVSRIAKYDKGIQIMDKEGEIVAVFHDDGFYVKGGKVKDLNELNLI